MCSTEETLHISALISHHYLGTSGPKPIALIQKWTFKSTSRGRVVNTPTSYSGGPGFKSRPADRLS
jgi:hypothetical protein